MKNKKYLNLFYFTFFAILVYGLLNDGGRFALYRSGDIELSTLLSTPLLWLPWFIFISLPFLLAYHFDWKKGFAASIIISILYTFCMMVIDTSLIIFIYTPFIILNIVYLIIASVVSKKYLQGGEI